MQPDVMVVRGGTTSFGAGFTQIEITPTQVVFIRNRSSQPEERVTGAVSPSEWRALVNAIDEAQLRAASSTSRCRLCPVDGPGEWVEVTIGSAATRVMFDFGATVEPIQPLVDAVRRIRQRFEG